MSNAAAAAPAPQRAGVLIVYSTTDGHTLKICERLRDAVRAQGLRVSLVALEDARPEDLLRFDKIVVGASIRYGKHSPRLLEFVEANAAALQARPSAFFSVNIVARKPEKNQPGTNPYVRKFLARTHWHPQSVEVFAGRLDYPRLGFIDRQMIRLIMWLTHGPTDPHAVVEFTDWQRVDAFALRVASL